jgi:hypothetical protein
VLGVLIPELSVDLEIPADLPSNTCAEIKPQFILAGVEYASVQRDNSVAARSPPLKKTVTGRTRNHRSGVQLARAMIKTWPKQEISTVQLRDRNVDNRADGDSIDLAAGPRRLSQLKGGRAEWKIGIEKVRSQPKIAAKIASYASSADSAPSLYIGASRSTGQSDADT